MFKNRYNAAKSMIASGAIALAGHASAAVPANVSTALTDGLADATTVAGLALIIVVGVAVFKYMRKGV